MRRARPALLFAAAAAVLALAVWRDAWPWIADDTFISLRYADNLVRGHGLCWNPGERVEGYSNLLWVLLTAALAWCGCDLVTAARGLAVAATAATLAVLAWSRLLPPRLPARLALLVLAAQASLAVWAIGGLEAPLAMLLVALAMLGLQRALAAEPPAPRWAAFAGVALALLAWTRPDGPLWAVVAAAVVGWRRRPQRARLLAAVLLPPAAAVAAQLAFRLAYYGDWVPNTAHAKVSPLLVCLTSGWHYLLSAGLSLRSLLAPALLGAALGWRRSEARPVLAFAALGAAAWSLYLLRVGGDIFPRNRFVVIAFAPLCVLAAHGLEALAARGRTGGWAAWALALACLGLARLDAERPGDDLRQQLSRWEWQAAAIGDWLGQTFAAQQPLVAVDAAGAVPFASRLPSLDMLGLNDRTIATTPLAPTRTFIVGHSRGNGAYVLARRPDLVLFNIPGVAPIPNWQSGVEMVAEPAFFRDYRLVSFETGARRLGDGTTANVPLTAWIRLDGRLGVAPHERRLVVPGHLLGSWRQAFPLVDPQPGERWLLHGGVVAVHDAAAAGCVGEVRRPGAHRLGGLPLPGGAWRATTASAPAGVAARLEAAADGRHDLVLDVPAATPLPFRLREVVLERVD
ncbi:MAG: hypothetical protein KF830_06265 [Planctomycetes bacterium]|nr:hypothetical protein [Planctomycetota bacterium]